MNSVILCGRLTKVPDLGYTQDDRAFCTFSLAVDKPVTGKPTEFFRVIVYGPQAEIVAEHAKRGTWLAVRGHLQARRYKEGERWRTIIEVVGESFEFIGVKSKDEEQPLEEDPEADEESPLETPPAN